MYYPPTTSTACAGIMDQLFLVHQTLSFSLLSYSRQILTQHPLLIVAITPGLPFSSSSGGFQPCDLLPLIAPAQKVFLFFFFFFWMFYLLSSPHFHFVSKASGFPHHVDMSPVTTPIHRPVFPFSAFPHLLRIIFPICYVFVLPPPSPVPPGRSHLNSLFLRALYPNLDMNPRPMIAFCEYCPPQDAMTVFDVSESTQR